MSNGQLSHVHDRELANRRKTWLYLALMVAAIVLVVIAVLVSI